VLFVCDAIYLLFLGGNEKLQWDRIELDGNFSSFGSNVWHITDRDACKFFLRLQLLAFLILS
jgi:hypothetical protein